MLIRDKDGFRGTVGMRLYKIYEEGELIFTGTAKEVMRRFSMSETSIKKYVDKKYKIWGRFDVVKADSIDTEQVDTIWDCLKMMLVVRKEKKTSVSKDPHKYVGRLKELGVEVKITPYMSLMIKDTDITAPPKDKRKPQKCWYVERV